MKIEAKDLQSALTEASIKLECSVVDLEYTILQQHKSGFLGFGRKSAIIEVEVKRCKKKHFKKENKPHFRNEEKSNHFQKTDKVVKTESEFKKNEPKIKKVEENEPKTEVKMESNKKEKYVVKSDAIFDSFHKEDHTSRNQDDLLDEIKIQLERLLKISCFQISLKEIKMYDENCIFIRLDGEDSALLIGKEAHRYKAFSYLLHNWINLKYNLLVRLEIAEFLEKQIQAMQFYLQGVAEKIKQSGRGQTKPLDGVLIKIALEELRAMFPHKYVGIKQNGEQRFVVVNDFVKKDE
ncbi:Jag N-terminal domain-containing protein [Campylobacter upsaliensis]|uniref:Jag N-terminal domain-containing protein n=1 Tax=Campylobacter upsaliensis TaxID=28080 RepID=UPI0022EB57E5|nr:Jag N-terminal domain-containing protein [Campylobacter upsaliensis]MEB2788913.1 Jag N-terminal domain-containing protein [Campylobacter upsaliensis]MEB2797982.1 Jag N-terminal domain-containing protein [Campylobacter upsaliensis]HEC1539583.1 Jag N-terminal domain-containing protein [Campylobacter upsaliensis]HEC1549855.1 Jag N-terminal domain-containing protein [Campylobacter upsaliensis]HEC1554997.1 Jag N-terminal domain-containing protein [Campylobacter upsaliensis]